MTSYYIDPEELWPVYAPRKVTKPLDRWQQLFAAEIPDEWMARYDQVLAEFNEMQDQLATWAEEAGKRYDRALDEHGCKRFVSDGWTGRRRRCNALPKDDGTCPRADRHAAET